MKKIMFKELMSVLCRFHEDSLPVKGQFTYSDEVEFERLDEELDESLAEIEVAYGETINPAMYSFCNKKAKYWAELYSC